jgi:hypothetical protein
MIFISHSENNRRAASALKDFLLEAMNASPEKIFLTRVHDPAPKDGKKISEQLRSDLKECRVVIAIITPESVTADGALFVLGAAWALGKALYFMYMEGVDFRDLPAPLGGFPSIDMEDKNAPIRLMGVCREIAADLKIPMKRGPGVLTALEKMMKAMYNEPVEDGGEAAPDASGQDEEGRFEEKTWSRTEYCEVVCAADSVARKEVIKVRILWDDLFKTLAPNMRQPQDAKFIESVLLGMCKDRDVNLLNGLNYKLLANPSVSSETFSRVISRLSVLEYISVASPPHTVFQKGSRGTFWRLTQNGEDYLRKLITERRKLSV